jgi:hypothetical protein
MANLRNTLDFAPDKKTAQIFPDWGTRPIAASGRRVQIGLVFRLAPTLASRHRHLRDRMYSKGSVMKTKAWLRRFVSLSTEGSGRAVVNRSRPSGWFSSMAERPSAQHPPSNKRRFPLGVLGAQLFGVLFGCAFST